jgi:methylmalonyl-CoA/ethylmalonyl-CoA epimerase
LQILTGKSIFAHQDDTLGSANTDERQAFVRDPEGNLVGLVEQRTRATP